MSVSRICEFYLATDNKWYLMLAEDEHTEEIDDCYAIGPFNSLEEAEQALVEAPLPNTGSASIDDSGTVEPPKTALLNSKASLLKGELK
jgi:hypothetical protein